MKYSLKILLLAVVTVGIVFGAWRYLTARQRTIDSLRRKRVSISYVNHFSDGNWINRSPVERPVDKRPTWLNSLFGDDFFSGGPVSVNFLPCRSAIADDDVVGIPSMRNLKVLILQIGYRSDGPKEIGCGNVSEANLVRLGELRSLRILDVPEARLSHRILRSWQDLRCLERLDLAATNLTDDLARTLPAFPVLRSLIMRETHVTEDVAPVLSRFPQLEYVDIRETEIGSAHIMSMQEQYLHIEFNYDR